MSQPYVSQDNPERVISEVIVEGVKIKENANAKSHSLADGLSKGTKVEIINENNGWYEVNIDGINGWIKTESVSIINVKVVKAGSEITDEPNGNTIDTLDEN